VALGAILVAILMGLRVEGTANSTPSVSCPPPSEPNQRLSARLLARLRGQSITRGLANGPVPLICFGVTADGTLRNNGVVLLDGRADERENAARLAHLLYHYQDREAVDIAVLSSAELSCAHAVDRIMSSEVHAHALENRVREAFGVRVAPHSLAALRRDYLARCQRVRSNVDSL
jgi:hypothetical protein